MWRYQVFARKLTWYLIGVYIMNRYPCKKTNFKRNCREVQGGPYPYQPPRQKKYLFLFYFQACEGKESSRSCNLIGSDSGRYFTILPANPDGIVGSFIHKFVCCLWMSKHRDFWTISFFKLALSLALAMEKGILFFRQKMWRKNQASLVTLSLLAGSPNYRVHPYR